MTSSMDIYAFVGDMIMYSIPVLNTIGKFFKLF